MKTLSVLVVMLGIFLTTMGQTSPDLSYNEAYNNGDYSGQYLEAEKVLYEEINFYRERHNLPACVISSRTVNYACRWGFYMMSKHVDVSNNFYQHSKLSPDEEYHIPSNTSEIIHLVYFDHYPSVVEAVSAIMYGINRGPTNSIIGFSQSKSHEACILDDRAKYYGCSIYVEKKDIYYTLYVVANFSSDK